MWNQVFAGVIGAPSEDNFPTEPYTTLDTTPVSREKPFLFVDAKGAYQVRVPSAAQNTRGTSWSSGQTPGRTLPLSAFYVAHPGDSAKRINTQLARGKNLLLTPGIYGIDRTLAVKRANAVVLGMGLATLTAERGAVPMTLADKPGIVVAGVTFDAGTVLSPVLLRVGKAGHHGHDKGHGKRRGGDHGHGGAASPTTLNDVYFRVGGPHVGKATVSLEVNSDDVLIDHTWVWRADHGVEGFTAGVSGDTDRWRTNIGRNGVVVNGDDVTATGLFVEHYQRHNTVWNGENGTVVLYQNELPYDPPSQAAWRRPDGTLGWAGFKVADEVRSHHLYGGGSYVYNRNDPSIVTARGFEVPKRPGVQLHHLLTVNLNGGILQHVVNDVGDAVTPDEVGTPSYVLDYP